MLVCVTTVRSGSGETVDPRFGRCEQFSFVNMETGEISHEPNDLAIGAGGVGAKVSQFLAERGVKAVVTGQVGPNAFRVLAAAGIEVYTVGNVTMDDALAGLREGSLTPVSAATGPARHAGH